MVFSSLTPAAWGSAARTKHQWAAAAVLPRSMDLRIASIDDLRSVEHLMNNRPRRILSWLLTVVDLALDGVVGVADVLGVGMPRPACPGGALVVAVTFWSVG